MTARMPVSTRLNQTMAANATMESTTAMAGNHGYSGALNGRSMVGSLLRSWKRLAMLIRYIITAPMALIVIRLPVTPGNGISQSTETTPTTPPATRAQWGVLNLLLTWAREAGRNPARASAKIWRL